MRYSEGMLLHEQHTMYLYSIDKHFDPPVAGENIVKKSVYGVKG